MQYEQCELAPITILVCITEHFFCHGCHSYANASTNVNEYKYLGVLEYYAKHNQKCTTNGTKNSICVI